MIIIPVIIGVVAAVAAIGIVYCVRAHKKKQERVKNFGGTTLCPKCGNRQSVFDGFAFCMDCGQKFK